MSDPRSFWGPCTWKFIHSIAAAYDPATPGAREAFIACIKSLLYLLSCKQCRDHLRANLKKLPIERYLSTNEQAFLWSYHLHDLVNRQLGKKSPPYLDVKRVYYGAMEIACESCKV